MAVADFAAYRALQASPYQTFASAKSNAASRPGMARSMWAVGPESGATPTTPEAPTNLTKGALGTFTANVPSILNGTDQRILSMAVMGGNVSVAGGVMILADRLSHQGGLDGTATGAQTTNLPTAALTRYSDGAGVWMGLEIYSQIGATGTTVVAEYTNQDGTGGQVTPANSWGATNNREAGRLAIMPLAPGDTGVRSVESVTAAATTGTAGNFGVTLFKPLVAYPLGAIEQVDIDGLFNNACLPVIEDDACLMWVLIPPTTATNIFTYTLNFSET